MSTFYVIDTASNEIINAVETDSLASAEASVARMVNPETLRVTEHPPTKLLHAYRYWDERP